ncbi:MAG: SMP-30/gluconolactonase/LRE family protein [Pseudomonadota bacterium]
MSVAIACDDRVCTLGEGPFWHPVRAQLFWFDILEHRLHSIDHGEPLWWDMGECTSCAGWLDRDHLMVVSETGFYRFSLLDGTRTLIRSLDADRGDMRSNDGRTDPLGGFWVGTMGKAAEPGAGAIYRLYQGALRKIHDGLTIPNSICFSPDGTLVYWADTLQQRILHQKLDRNGWPDGPIDVLVDLSEAGFYPDGSVTDASGGLWNAQWGAARVARYTPDGQFDRSIAVGGVHTTCPVFAGPELDQLFVTTATDGMDAPDAQQGRLFRAEPRKKGHPDPQLDVL